MLCFRNSSGGIASRFEPFPVVPSVATHTHTTPLCLPVCLSPRTHTIISGRPRPLSVSSLLPQTASVMSLSPVSSHAHAPRFSLAPPAAQASAADSSTSAGARLHHRAHTARLGPASRLSLPATGSAAPSQHAPPHASVLTPRRHPPPHPALPPRRPPCHPCPPARTVRVPHAPPAARNGRNGRNGRGARAARSGRDRRWRR